MKKFTASVVILFALLSGNSLIKAWVYPEHRDITLFAIQKLSTSYRELLDQLWSDARKGFEFRLNEAVIDPEQTTKPLFLDYASWPAIAGDHSCSAENMLHNILETDWIMQVADITAQLKIDLLFSKDRTRRMNGLRTSDLRLQGADPEYATRAGSNNVHFLLSLHDVDMDALSYILSCLNKGTELNAISAYSWYHYSALSKASRLYDENLTEKERSALTLSALSDEAFAIHFLQDMFAAGHVAGTWGDASQRKGTHDFYNERGLKVSTWEGDNAVLTGDAWMRTEDAERAAYVISLSITQLLDAVHGRYSEIFNKNEEIILTPNNYNVCQNNFVPDHEPNPAFMALLKTVLLKTPVPAMQKGKGELPRFRAELGAFVGFSPSFKGWMLSSGYGIKQKTIGVAGGIEVAGRFGIGLDGVLNESGDGLVFLDLGWRQDGTSSLGVINDPTLQSYGNLLAAIPGRSAYNVRLRLPFYLLPGDLLILGPTLFLIDKEALTDVGVAVVNGGLIPWQAGIETSFGRFQFVLGREIAVYLYGRTKAKDALFNISPNENGLDQIYILSYRSTQIEFPFLEYRPFRSFDADQRSSLFIQLYGAIDIPHNVENISDTDVTEPAPDLKTIYNLGLRLIFDWRHYF